jgi:hypothetical protein
LPKREAGDPGAMGAFAAHVGRHADDQLASFHFSSRLSKAMMSLTIGHVFNDKYAFASLNV